MARDILEIRRDIQDSRDRLRQTAEAIGWKADVPARARDVLRETAAVVRERVNTGNGAPPGGGSGGPSLLDRARSAATGVKESVSSATSTVGDAVGSAASTVGSAASSVGSAASSVGEGARSAGSTVGSGASSATGAVSSAKDTALERMPSAEDARAGAQRAASMAKANAAPLAIGALALGIAAGMLLPSTRVEDETIGPVADDLRSEGAERASEAIQRGREAVTA